jgi:formate hydrogenlyase subunit 3/multisubunit Na+/H+ antiporter MnhD subunit
MVINSTIYIAIFFPLIASLFCHLLAHKNFAFFIAIFSSFATIFLIAQVALFGGEATNDFNLSAISLALEFKLDKVSSLLLTSLILAKILSLLFYQKNLKKYLDNQNGGKFYAVFLINIFAITGIFSANNIFNLFLFIEIYHFSYFASTSILKNDKLSRDSFDYFCLNSIASLLILLVFIALFLLTKEVNFDKISSAMPLILNPNLAPLLFAILLIAMVIKFFPTWLFFKKIKNTNPSIDFFAIDTLFIKSAIGIVLSLKFIHYFFNDDLNFNNISFALILFCLSFVLIIYSAYKIYQQKNLKTLASYCSFNNLFLILGCIAVGNSLSNKAIIFYLLNLITVNLAIFIFASFLKRHFKTANINKISLLKQRNFLSAFPLKLSIFFIAALPFSFLFLGNWYLFNAIFQADYSLILSLAILISMLAQLSLARRLLLLLNAL